MGLSSSTTLKSVIAKIARFEFKVPWVETETAIYQAIDGQGIWPAFLGHLVEHGRVMGFLIKKIDGGAHGEIGDLVLGIVHGDLNKYNFIVGPTRTALIDFENAIKKMEAKKQCRSLTEQLTE